MSRIFQDDMTPTAVSFASFPTATRALRPPRILVAADGSTHAARAVDAAGDLARRLGASVDAVAAWDVASPRVIVETADDVAADLIVLGSRGLGPMRRVVPGSTSENVLQTSRRPALVVRGGAKAWPPRRVVAAHDASPAAHDAARMAAVLAGAVGAGLELVGVVGGRDRCAPSLAEEELRVLLDSASARIGARLGVQPSVTVRRGDPTNELLAAAAGDPSVLIALGSCDGTRVGHRLGRTATRILHSASGPVLVVPWSPALPF